MFMIADTNTIVQNALYDLWARVIGFLPQLVMAVVVFFIGIYVANLLSTIVERVLRASRVDTLLRRMGLEEYTRRANMELNFGHFIGQIVYWFFFLVVLLASSDILHFYNLSSFINVVLAYIPNLLIAVLIMVAAFVIANLVKRVVRASVMGARLHAAKFLSSAAWWAIVILGLLASLTQLGIATSFIETFLTGLIGMVALAGGIAFGLGGKEYASEILKDLRDELQGRE